jgi:hypothetical protein
MPGQFDIIALNQSIARGAIADARQMLNDLLDKISANKRLKKMGEEKGFLTFEHQECFAGWRFMRASDAALLLYGTTDTSSLAKLCGRYDLLLYSLRSVGHHGQQIIRNYFNIAPKAPNFTFASWKHFLLGGLKGETDLAKQVGAYLLAMETHGRIREETDEQDPGAALHRMVDILVDHTTTLKKHGTTLEEHDGRLIVIEGGKYRKQRIKFPQYVEDALLDIAKRIGRCICCKEEYVKRNGKLINFSRDHVKPPSQGGLNNGSNGQPLCMECNRIKDENEIDYRTGPYNWIKKELEQLDREHERPRYPPSPMTRSWYGS